MSQIPANLLYVDTHEWILDNGDGTVLVGVTDHAQELLGDVVFVELPEVGREMNAGEEFGVIESVKAASDLYSPVSGEVLEVNEALNDTPELANSEPYEGGWIVKLRLTQPEEVSQLLTAEAYAKVVEDAQ
ncbi:glycine cleavage system protein GcvH [Pokkaliibacter sp. CJK22405]|uniref:glycine cleavage system protein GcvH n=1 Tax=Pokkaliibacter sp. CJK22405 TaxID=3384615 RepID=UPI0039854BD0